METTINEPELVLIPLENVGTVWHLGADYIQSGLKMAEFSLEEVRLKCCRGDAQLWYAWSGTLEAATVTWIVETPQGNKLVVVATGGKDSYRWLWMLDLIEGWAKSQGCNGMRIYGRKGWARKLRDYRITRVILDKDI